jgi:hypothetical protein
MTNDLSTTVLVTAATTLGSALLMGAFKTLEIKLAGGTAKNVRFYDDLFKELENARRENKEKDHRINVLESEIFELKLTLQRHQPHPTEPKPEPGGA